MPNGIDTQYRLPFDTRGKQPPEPAKLEAPAAPSLADADCPPATRAAFVRPDRQTNFEGLPHEDWPEPSRDKDTLTVDRVRGDIDGPAHRFVIELLDVVEVFVSKDELRLGEVSAVCVEERKVSVRFRKHLQGEWFEAQQIYPTADKLPADFYRPSPERNGDTPSVAPSANQNRAEATPSGHDADGHSPNSVSSNAPSLADAKFPPVPNAAFIRPDRQEDYGGIPHFDWPEPTHDRDTITVDRIRSDEPSYRFTVCRGDTVDVFFSKDKREVGEVVGISHANDEVRVRFKGSSRGIWFYKGKIYPVPEALQVPEQSRTTLSETVDEENAKHSPKDGFAESDRVPSNGNAPSTPSSLDDDVLSFLREQHGTETSLRELRQHFGREQCDPLDPQSNPVNLAVKRLRDVGRVHLKEPKWGEPRVSVLTWPTTEAEWSTWSYPESLEGPEVVHLMNRFQVTIRELAARMQITQKRIREVRDGKGLAGKHTVRDWAEHIAKPAVSGGVYTLDDHKAFQSKANAGEITAGEWKSEFERCLASRSQFIAALQSEFNANQLKNLAGRLGNFGAGQNTKYENARAVFRSILTSFLVSNSFRFDPMRETQEEAVAREVRAIDQPKLEDYFKQRGLNRAAHEKATTNPETLEEFRTFIRAKGEDGLSDSQLALYDSLMADQARARRRARVTTTVEKLELDAAGDLGLTITEGFHEKKKCPLWIVKLSTRVDRAVFSELKQKARMLGGWYSSFKKADAGFQFLSEESAAKFAGLLDGDADRTDELEARKERKEETAAERLSRLSDELRTRAEEVLEADTERLKNTARRAEMAAGIRGRAYADIALASTLSSIADALGRGEATYIDGIRHKTHAELLMVLLGKAKANHNDKRERDAEKVGEPLSYAEREVEAHRIANLSDVRFAEYPYPAVYKRHLEDAIRTCGGKKGCKQVSVKMAKRIRDEGDFVSFEGDHDVATLIDFESRVKAAGFDAAWPFHSLAEFRRLRACGVFTLHELRAGLREFLPHVSNRPSDDPVTKAEDDLRGRKLPGFFPTPGPVIERMLALADVQPGHSVLEPSCGKGDIVKAIQREQSECHVTAIELNQTLADVLSAKGIEAEFADFLGHEGHYDRILMNPPFESGKDIDHVRHAYSLLVPGGTLVSVMSEGPFFREDKKAAQFRDWLDEVSAETEKLPDDAFLGTEAFRETSVRTRLVVISRD